MAKIIVAHSGYGCDTGCCGHVIDVDDVQVRGTFEFDHADALDEETKKKFAEELIRRQMGEEHVKDLDWENCEVVSYDDCYNY